MLLIHPATEQFGGFLSRYIPLGLPIAVGTLAGYLEQFGHQVCVFDDLFSTVFCNATVKQKRFMIDFIQSD